MRPVKITQGAIGSTLWTLLDKQLVPFSVSLAAIITSGASLTYTVHYTYDDPGVAPRKVTVTRAAAVATVVDPDHRLSVGDSIIVAGTGSTNLDGSFDVATVVDANTYTYAVANSGATADVNASTVVSMRVYSLAALATQTTRKDASLVAPVMAIRLNVSVYVSGKVDLVILQGLSM